MTRLRIVTPLVAVLAIASAVVLTLQPVPDAGGGPSASAHEGGPGGPDLHRALAVSHPAPAPQPPMR